MATTNANGNFSVKSVFQDGIKLVVPFLLTLFLVYWLFIAIDDFMRWLLLLVLEDAYYFRGLGWVVVLLLVFVAGLASRINAVGNAIATIRSYVLKLPLVKPLYNTSSDLTSLFTKKRKADEAAVLLHTPIGKVLGIVTQSDLKSLPAGIGEENEIAVYVQMSYNMGGYTFIVPKDSVEPLDLSVKEAFALTMSGYVTGRK